LTTTKMAAITPYTDVITLYDIPGTTPKNAWSINTWKTRFVLNYKKIPYKTTWIAYPDIQPTFERLGIKHTAVRPDGQLYYSVPAITDPHPVNSPSPIHVSDSWDIAVYLDKKYPEPPLFPHGTEGLQKFFVEKTEGLLLPRDLYHGFIVNGTFAQLTEESKSFFRETREKRFGKRLEELAIPPGEKRDAVLKDAQEKYLKVAEYMVGGSVMPPHFVYADLVTAGILMWVKVVCAEDVWPIMAKWDDGKWGKYVDEFDAKYGQVV